MDFESKMNEQIANGDTILEFPTKLKQIKKDDITTGVLKTKKFILDSYWDTFMEGHDKLMMDDSFETCEYTQKDTYAKVEDAYLEAQAFIAEHLEKLKPPEPKTEQIRWNLIKLPKIPLPEFSGEDYLEWPNFRELFKSLVHNDREISDSTRLEKLKSALTGSAASLVAGLPVTDENYKVAWDKLMERYDDKRIFMRLYFNQLFSIKPMTAETASEVGKVLYPTLGFRNSLKSLGCPVEYWDDWFVYLTTQKLLDSMLLEWEMSNKDRSHIPTFDELTKFLWNKIHLFDMQESYNRPPKRYNKKKSKRFQVQDY